MDTNKTPKDNEQALAGVARVVGVSSHNRKVAGSIAGQCAHLGCGFEPWSEHIGPLVQARTGGSQLMFLSLPSSLSESNEKVSLGEDKKKKKTRNSNRI